MAIVTCYGGTYAKTDGAGNPTFRSDSHVDRFMAYLPKGRAWTRQAGSTVYGLYRGISHEFARVARRALELVLYECSPLTASEMLVDWERFVGMPRFGVLATTVAQRRIDVHREYTYRPDLSPDGIIADAAARGFTVDSVERRVYEATNCTGVCNAPIYGDEWLYVWRVHADVPSGDRPAFETWLESIEPIHAVMLIEYA